MTALKVGIDKLSLYVPEYYIDMVDLGHARGIDPDKFTIGIGQSKQAVNPLNQDPVSMAANAALKILNAENKEQIDQVIFATESSFDYSKAGATYLKELLDLPSHIRAYEIKQACYGATAALLSACDYVSLRPDRKVLIVSADIARYGLETPGEATQGSGAMAMIVSAEPSILAIDQKSYPFTVNEYDFWRPEYCKYPKVDGKFSTELYIHVFEQVMLQLEKEDPKTYQQLEALVMHVPFTKMVQKALAAYAETTSEISPSIKEAAVNRWQNKLNASLLFGREVGNIYTGSLYLSLLSLLVNADGLQVGDRIALFSYGSGAVGELITGSLQENYLGNLEPDLVRSHLEQRVQLSIPEYEAMYSEKLELIDGNCTLNNSSEEINYYLDRIDGDRRYYKYNENGKKVR